MKKIFTGVFVTLFSVMAFAQAGKGKASGLGRINTEIGIMGY